jgi:DmsE family decaheme c-type cytochrome
MEDVLWAKLAVNSMSAVRRQLGTTDRIKPNRKLIPLLCGGLICWAVSSLAQPAMAGGAQSPDGSYVALAEFAQQVGTTQPKSAPIKSSQAASSDELYSVLAQFTQEVGAKPLKLAAAEKSNPNPWDITNTVTPKASGKTATKSSGGGGADEATFVGTKVCLGCHTSQATAFEQTLMGRIGKVQKGKMECENCHGAGSAHVKAGGGRGVGGIISFRDNDKSRPVEANNAICLNCHENGHRTYWNGSTHETRGLACTNCHQVMKRTSVKNQMKKDTEADTCFQCHKDRQAQMLSSAHMPQREGKMTCSDCHNPHGSFSEALLKENSVNDTCYKCHADKRGPFLWEHYPVRDNCTNCHRPHGSNNEKMLKMMVPRLCAQCHTAGHGSAPLGNPAAVQSFNRGCLNCHSKIHGSNAPGGILFQR